MDQSFLDAQRVLLQQERDIVETDLAAVAATDRGDHAAGDYAPTFPNYGNDNLMENSAGPGEVADFAVNADVTGTLEDRLHAIDSALERIDDGSYGTCIDCGVVIPVERLQASASASQCIQCAGK